jgi:2'-5' RNA ligase
MPDKQRLFLGMEIYAPWAVTWPGGRLLEESSRHVTLVFLGSVLLEEVNFILRAFPTPLFSLGPVGLFDQCLFLPKQKPRAAAWHIVWQELSILSFQEELARWLRENGFAISRKPWFPHATLCRQPFEEAKWKESFQKLPCYAGTIHLYEHAGSLKYKSHWSWPLFSPFQEIEHAADIAFHVYGAVYPSRLCHRSS